MRSVQLVAPRRLEPRDLPLPPDPGPGEVLVRVRAVGICGSDMHWYLEGAIGANQAVYPQVLGHEPAGEVAVCGPGVAGKLAGRKVALEPAITCGTCELCRAGRHNNCACSVFMSSPQMPGLFREYALMPARNVVPVPDSMSFEEATIVEPLAVILHVLELAPIRVGETVAVLGAGSIGLLTIAVARLAGASRIFAVDPVPHRLELAGRMGADVALDSASAADAVRDLTRGRGVDLVVDAAGAVESINLAMLLARIAGRVVLIGIPSLRAVPLDVHAAMTRELSIQTIKRSNHNAHGAIELLEAGRIPGALLTHRFPLEQTPRAFETLAAYADGIGKAVVQI
jgi:L-iditol 2-dehydrogenase